MGVKLRLDAGHDFTLSELSCADVEQGEFFHCPICQIAWDAKERKPYDLPTFSPSPGGFLSDVTSGRSVSDTVSSKYRLLGYSDEGNLMLRDIGNVDLESINPMEEPIEQAISQQLGDVFEVVGSGYPKPLQILLNALRSGYCLEASIGLSNNTSVHEIDVTESYDIVEAIPVDYAIEADFIPEFADDVWEQALEDTPSMAPFPSGVGTLENGHRPVSKVHVFPKEVRNEEGVPLIAGIQRGDTHHLELFTNDPGDQLFGDMIDVIFIAPKNRPYFAVYCISHGGLDLAHNLRAELDLPVVHRGRDAMRLRVFDIRYNPDYVTRLKDHDMDLLIPNSGANSKVDIATGEVEGDYFNVRSEPHEVVVTVNDDDRTIEVARLRAPSVRVDQ